MLNTRVSCGFTATEWTEPACPSYSCLIGEYIGGVSLSLSMHLAWNSVVIPRVCRVRHRNTGPPSDPTRNEPVCPSVPRFLSRPGAGPDVMKDADAAPHAVIAPPSLPRCARSSYPNTGRAIDPGHHTSTRPSPPVLTSSWPSTYPPVPVELEDVASSGLNDQCTDVTGSRCDASLTSLLPTNASPTVFEALPTSPAFSLSSRERSHTITSPSKDPAAMNEGSVG